VRLARPLAALWQRLGDIGQIAVSAITSIALMIGMLLTWGDALPSLFRRESVGLGAAFVTAGLIYVQPHVFVTLIAAAALFVIVYHRLDLGLALGIFYAPFFLFPVELFRFAFPMAELVLLIVAAAWVLRGLAAWGKQRRAGMRIPPVRLRALDWGVAVWVVLAVMSLSWTEYPRPAITELRTQFLEPLLFYAMLRTIPLGVRERSRLIDSLILSGVAVAAIGLFLYMRGDAVIVAEGGARRLSSVYGSPNNVGLWLGRCIPFALAFVLASLDRPRRVLSALALVLMGVAVLLSQSAGAIFLGIPAGIAVVLILTWRRHIRLVLAALLGSGAGVLVLAMQFPRFARMFDIGEGTSFFRLRGWQSALEMIRDHPITGLGLDQFLYFFRGRYIMPDAWQEPNLSHPHNVVLDVWTRLGVGGLILFAWLQIAFWRQALRGFRSATGTGERAILVGTMGSMAALLAHGLIDNSVFVVDLALLYALLLALVADESSKPSPN
jgi:O-antigen ligase